MSAPRRAPGSKRRKRFSRRSRTGSGKNIPPQILDLILDNIGLPQRVYNLAFTDGSTIGVNDGTIQIALKEGHPPTADIVKKLRRDLTRTFPDVLFYFAAGGHGDANPQFRHSVADRRCRCRAQTAPAIRRSPRHCSSAWRRSPGLVDVHIQQELDAPELYYDIDRIRAQQIGLNVNSIANNLNISLSSSEQVSPNFWTDPKNGIPYYFAVQTPEYRIASLNDLNNTPIVSQASADAPVPNMLGNVATMHRTLRAVGVQSRQHSDVYDIYASVQDSDLGARCQKRSTKSSPRLAPKLKPGNKFVVRGQIDSMNSAFRQSRRSGCSSRRSSSIC